MREARQMIGTNKAAWGLDGPSLTRRSLLACSAAAVLAGCTAPFDAGNAEDAFPPIGDFVQTSAGRVHLWRAGPTDPLLAERKPAVLIHGASGNLRDFTFAIAPKIAETRPVIAVDRPGFGYTDRPDGTDTPAAQAAMLREAVGEIGVDQPLVLGHSYGAAVTMAWALDAPETVSGIIPVSGVTMPYRGMGRVLSALGLAGIVTWAYSEYLKSVANDGGIERFLDRVFRPQRPPPGYPAYIGAPLALRQGTLDANGRDLEVLNGALIDMAPRYANMSTPAEIIHGAADFIDPGRQSVALKTAIPNGRLTLLPNVGHMAHHVGTDTLIEALDRLDPAERA